jgi:hexokinase
MIHCGALNDGTDEPIDIGVDGSVIEHYPFYRHMVYEGLRAIKEIGTKGADRVRIGITKDGSGVGAALIALVSDKTTLVDTDL